MAEAFQERGIDQSAGQVAAPPEGQQLLIPAASNIETSPDHLGWGDLMGQLAEGVKTGRDEMREFFIENRDTITKIAIGVGVFAGVSVAAGVGMGIVEFVDAQPVRWIDLPSIELSDWEGLRADWVEYWQEVQVVLRSAYEYSKPLLEGGYVQTTLDTGGPLETIADALGISREAVPDGCQQFDVTQWNPGELAQQIRVEAVNSVGEVVDATTLSHEGMRSAHNEVVFCAEDIAGAVTTKVTESVRSTALKLP